MEELGTVQMRGWGVCPPEGHVKPSDGRVYNIVWDKTHVSR